VPRDLSESVVVITGGSSGIGRAAAHAFARRGATLVLAARAPGPLTDAVRECETVGTQALAVPTDVRDPEAVQALAATAVDRFGSLDVWVNCAGVICYGRFLDVPADVFRAVVETNLLGQVHGARAALTRFRDQRYGTLINTSSVWGRITSPDVSSYVASKFAVRAFSESLLQELRDDPDIHVATILPQAVDTPIFARAANFARHPVRPVPPLLRPEKIAEGIVQCAVSPEREITYRRMGRLLQAFHSLAPDAYARVMAPVFEAGSFSQGTTEATTGAVIDALPATEAVDGRWKQDRRNELRRALRDAILGGIRGLLAR
jgi:NAD(P)-dependent dehydrogenase (short-subunit alcohol dehydrogenase family)